MHGNDYLQLGSTGHYLAVRFEHVEHRVSLAVFPQSTEEHFVVGIVLPHPLQTPFHEAFYIPLIQSQPHIVCLGIVAVIVPYGSSTL